MKLCGKCRSEKPVSSFHKRSASKDGLAALCKECQSLYDALRKDCEERKRKRKQYSLTEKGIKAGNRAKIKYIKNNPAKREAHIKVGNAIKKGVLVKQPCEYCGSSESIHAHHDDYSKPLEVRWLCPQCHYQWHKDND